MEQYKAILRRKLGSVIAVALLSILTSLGMVFAGYSLSFLYTAYEYDGARARALLYTFMIVSGIWLAAMAVYYVALVAKAGLKREIKNELRGMVAERLASLEHAELISRDSGSYISWLTNDVDQLWEQAFAPLFEGIENMAAAIFSLGALCLLSPFIGIAAVILLLVISVLPRLADKRLRAANAKRSEAIEVGTERYKDAVMGSTVLYLNNLRHRIRERILAASAQAEQVSYRFERTSTAVRLLISTVSMLGQVLLLFVTLMAAIAGAAPAGAALSVGNLAGSFFNGAGSFVQAFMTIRASAPLWDKFKPAAGPLTAKPDIDAIPAITLRDVSFGYGDRAVLEHQSFTFEAGGKYAIMGASGSGKTTLARILLGLLPDYVGRVEYGAREQRSVSAASLYRHIAYVDQQVYLFQDTVRFNITLGEDYTEEELAAVIKVCRLEDYVKSLPGGLDTMIMENGKNLSGGQRQRIALARGLIRRVQYIILDEGTSALDEANALEIETELLSTPELCVIIITHRLRESVRNKLTCVYSLKSPAGH